LVDGLVLFQYLLLLLFFSSYGKRRWWWWTHTSKNRFLSPSGSLSLFSCDWHWLYTCLYESAHCCTHSCTSRC
jgi:hypothetical protein